MQKRNSLVVSVILLLVVMGHPYISLGQDIDLRPVTEKYAIINATIVQAPGSVLQKGAILIEGGIIKSVGTDISIPKDAWVIDADSMFVYPGFISGMSTFGVEKPKEEKRNDDDRSKTGSPTNERAGITPQKSVVDLLSSEEKSIEAYRQLGFTAAQTVPTDGMLPGTAAIILLGGETRDEMILKNASSMSAQLQGASGVYPNTVIGVMAKYRDLYRQASQARAYEKRYSASPNGMERPIKDPVLQALYPVVNGEMSVLFKTEGIKDIMRVIALQKELGFNLALGEVKQGWDAIPFIKSLNVPVFLSLDLPDWKEAEESEEEMKDKKAPTPFEEEEKALKNRQYEVIKKYYTQASAYQKSGIKYGFSTMEVKSKDFKANLLKMIENGLSPDHALAALTINPANILGVSNTMGSIAPGKIANLIVTDTAYFTKEANVKHVFVEGAKYDYEIKEKKKASSGKTIDAAGVWNYTTETPQGDGSGVITIEGTPGDYSGTISVSYNDSTNEIENIEIDGNTISFSFDLDMGQAITVNISMEIEGDSFDGNLSIASYGSFPMEGSRDPK